MSGIMQNQPKPGKDYTFHFVAAYVGLGLAIMATAFLFVFAVFMYEDPAKDTVRAPQLARMVGEQNCEKVAVQQAKQIVSQQTALYGAEVDQVKTKVKGNTCTVTMRFWVESFGVKQKIPATVELSKGVWAVTSIQ